MTLRLMLFLISLIPATGPQKPALSFDVASIKPNNSGGRNSVVLPRPGGGFTATNVTMMQLMRFGFSIQEFQVSGQLPNWFNIERFDIEARADVQGEPRAEVWQPMLQALLADRFKLAFHKEVRAMPAYDLIVSKNGHKLQRVEPGECLPPPAGMCGTFRASTSQIIGDRVSMEAFATRLTRSMGRTVVDKTKVEGVFNLLLQWTPDPQPGVQVDAPPPDGGGPTIFTALQEQLGLRLEATKNPVEVYVIDRVERPSEN